MFVDAFADELEKISGRLSGLGPAQKDTGWGTMRSEIASDLLKQRKNVQAERSMRHAPAFDPNAERKQKVQSLAQRIKAQRASQAAPQPSPQPVQPPAPQPAPAPPTPFPNIPNPGNKPGPTLRQRLDRFTDVSRSPVLNAAKRIPGASTVGAAAKSVVGGIKDVAPWMALQKGQDLMARFRASREQTKQQAATAGL